MFLAGLHSPAARSGAAAGIKHGLVQLTEKMPLSVLIYRVRCRGPQQGTRTCPPLPALPVPALRAPRLVSGTARPRPAASQDSESQRCRESPRSRRGLGKRQEQRSVPRLPEKPPSCLRSPSPAARSALSPLLAAAQAPRWHRPQALRSFGSTASPRSCRWLQPPGSASRCPRGHGGASVCGRPPCAAVALELWICSLAAS